MKTTTRRSLKFTKISIAVIDKLLEKSIKGGTEPISVPMTQAPDEEGICYAIR